MVVSRKKPIHDIVVYSLFGLRLRNLSDSVELSLDLRSFFGSINSGEAGDALVIGGDEGAGDWRGARLKNEVGGLIFGCAIVGDDD